jgi:hypothetical protein
MASKKISELPASGALTGAELVEAVQGGINVQTTTQDIADLGGGGGGGHTIEDEGTPLTQRTKLNFVGAGVTVTDDSGDDATVVTISSGGGTGTVESVTGDGVDNTDPDNPVLIFPVASEVVFTPAGTISATDVQAAIEELDAAVLGSGVQDLPIPAQAMWRRQTSGCASLQQYEIATSLLNIQGLEFSSSAQQFAQMNVPLPRRYNNGTITAVIHWKPLESGSGDVRWGIQMASYRNDDPLTGAFGTEVAVTDTFIATDDLHITTASAAITPSGTLTDGNLFALQINRDPTNGSDTLDVNAILISVILRITCDAHFDS